MRKNCISLRLLFPAWCFVFASLLFSAGLGLAFGGAEAELKAGLAEAGPATVYGGDEAKRGKVLKKAWSYHKRAHLHGLAMGTTAGVLLLLLGSLTGRPRWRQLAGISLGAGSFVYAVFWLLAGRAAPALGSTAAAKESLRFLAGPSALLFVLGIIATFALLSLELGGADER